MSRRRYRRRWPISINWGWMAYRWHHTRHCLGTWEKRGSHQTCDRCGVWRWFPVLVRRKKHLL